MKCPYCGNYKSFIVESRSGDPSPEQVVRIRHCAACFGEFITSETVLNDEEGRQLINAFRKKYRKNRVLPVRRKEKV